jgi:hypothetical protein
MAGRPRTQRADRLAFNMLRDLHEHGPQTISELLDRQLCGPALWEQMAQWEHAASRMAVRTLLCGYGVRLGVDGRLHPPPRQRRRAA